MELDAKFRHRIQETRGAIQEPGEARIQNEHGPIQEQGGRDSGPLGLGLFRVQA